MLESIKKQIYLKARKEEYLSHCKALGYSKREAEMFLAGVIQFYVETPVSMDSSEIFDIASRAISTFNPS